jgi:hypothetical protein
MTVRVRVCCDPGGSAAGSGKSKGLNAYDPEYIDELLGFWKLHNDLVKQEFGDSLDMQQSLRVSLPASTRLCCCSAHVTFACAFPLTESPREGDEHSSW